MTAEPKKKVESMTDWARLERQEKGLEPIDCSDIPELDKEWFAGSQLTYLGQITMKVNIEAEILAWYEKQWPGCKTVISKLLTYYKQKNMPVLAPQEPLNKPVLLVAKFDPDVVKWLKESPDYHVRTNQILRDFMHWCIEKGEPQPES